MRKHVGWLVGWVLVCGVPGAIQGEDATQDVYESVLPQGALSTKDVDAVPKDRLDEEVSLALSEVRKATVEARKVRDRLLAEDEGVRALEKAHEEAQEALDAAVSRQDAVVTQDAKLAELLGIRKEIEPNVSGDPALKAALDSVRGELFLARKERRKVVDELLETSEALKPLVERVETAKKALHDAVGAHSGYRAANERYKLMFERYEMLRIRQRSETAQTP